MTALYLIDGSFELFRCYYGAPRARLDDKRRTAMVNQSSVALCTLLSIILTACDKSPTAPTSSDTVVSAAPDTVVSAAPDTVVSVVPDFNGQVLTPRYVAYSHMRNTNRPVQGVGVTIVTGPRAGERVETGEDGRYSFPEFDGDELHLRLEKNDYEPKEVIVHRTGTTTLPDRVPLLYNGPQKKPGTVLIGLQWPDYIRPLIMQQMEVMPDLLLMFADAYDDGRSRAFYGYGVVALTDTQLVAPMFHEVCHAHQNLQAGISGDSSVWVPRWEASPEGKAYILAQTADIDGGYSSVTNESPVERSAETCSSFWQERPEGNPWLKRNAPNRFAWAEKWLPKPE